MVSQYVCKRCGVNVHPWGRKVGETFWKHSTGGRGPKTCGHPPIPIRREEYNHLIVLALKRAKETISASE